MLTEKQKELLLYIHKQTNKTGISPSFDEMKDALDLKSKSGIHRLIKALEERGFIRRLPNRARALEVLKMPEGSAPALADSDGDLATSVPPEIAGPALKASAVSVPVMGRIAAGVPISAIQVQSNTVEVPSDIVGRGEHYALEVRGDSMIDAGILDGDTVIIQKSSTASNGDIVVAFLVEEEEATLKRLRRKGDSIALEAANPKYEPRIFSPDQVRVQGKLVGLIRRY